MTLTVVSSSHTYPYCLLVTHTSDNLANRRPHQLPCTEAGRHSKSVEGPGKSLLPCRKPLCLNHAAKLTLVALISIPLTPESHKVLVPHKACREQTRATRDKREWETNFCLHKKCPVWGAVCSSSGLHIQLTLNIQRLHVPAHVPHRERQTFWEPPGKADPITLEPSTLSLT